MPSIVPLTPRHALQATIDLMYLRGSTEETADILDRFVFEPMVDALHRAGFTQADHVNINPALMVLRKFEHERNIATFRTVFPTFLAIPQGWAAQGWRAYTGLPAELQVIFVDGPCDGLVSTVPADADLVQMPTPTTPADELDEELQRILNRRPATFHLEREEKPVEVAKMGTTVYHRAGYDLDAARWAYSTRPTFARGETDA